METNNKQPQTVKGKGYCEHMKAMVCPKLVPNTKLLCTECKTPEPLVWICLSKGCGSVFCEKNKFKHVNDHKNQTKLSHHIFINSCSAELRCMICEIEILDHDQLLPQQLQIYSQSIDAFSLRHRFLPKPVDSFMYMSVSQIENSHAHRKSNRGIGSLQLRRPNSTIHSVVQFISNIPYLKHILKNTKWQGKYTGALATVIRQIWSGELRNISLNILPEVSRIVYDKMPRFKGYHKKDPYQLFSYTVTSMHEELKFYQPLATQKNQSYDNSKLLQTTMQLTKTTVNNYLKEEVTDMSKSVQLSNKNSGLTQDSLRLNSSYMDEWDMWQNIDKFVECSPVKQPFNMRVRFYFECNKCKQHKTYTAQLNRLELEMPKVKRQTKEIEDELQKRNYQSPFQKRRKSLLEKIMGSEEQPPLTLLEILLNYSKNKCLADYNTCAKCKAQNTFLGNRIIKLPNLLILYINRNQKDTTVPDHRVIDLPDTLDLKGFCDKDVTDTAYELCSSICMDGYNEYIALAKNCKNKQRYEFRNGANKISQQKYPVYLVCYVQKSINLNFYRNIKSNVKASISPDYPLPDYWLIKLKNFTPGPLVNPAVCVHGALKPRIQSKLIQPCLVPQPIFEALLDRFKGRLMLSNSECQVCFKHICGIQLRKKKQKEIVTKLDSYKVRVHCMIWTGWLERWREYLYGRKDAPYCCKGLPLPGPIRNTALLENQTKCKANLKKGQDYKVVNYYVWTFFKQLYGGGPEVQYKTKSEQSKGSSPTKLSVDQEIMKEISENVKQLKQYLYSEFYMNYDWQEERNMSRGKSFSHEGASSMDDPLLRSRQSF